mgnify:CR=1 FL=1
MAAESVGMSQKKKDRAATIGMIIFFSILAILTVLPIYLLVLASFKPGNFLLQYGLNLNLDIPHLTLDNYKLLFTGKHDYWTWFGNSLILTVITVILTLAISAFVAYGFAAYDFKGKNFFFIIVLLILSVPFEVIMLPLYKQISSWGMMDSYVSVVLPFLAHASTIFFFRQYLLGLPKSLIEAGRIDGATEYGIFFKLIVPIMKPAFSAMAILNGMNAWNNYLWPTIILQDKNEVTMPMLVANLKSGYSVDYGMLMLGVLICTLPTAIIFLCLQKSFANGIAGAVK